MKGELNVVLQEVSKGSSQAAKLVAAGDGALARASSIKEGELMEMNLKQLRLVAEEAEEVFQLMSLASAQTPKYCHLILDLPLILPLIWRRGDHLYLRAKTAHKQKLAETCHFVQVSLNLTRAVKFNRVPGGWNAENVATLLESSKQIATRLASCNRVVKTLLPMK